MGKVKSIASSAVQRVAPSAFIFHFSFTTPPSNHHQLLSLPLYPFLTSRFVVLQFLGATAHFLSFHSLSFSFGLIQCAVFATFGRQIELCRNTSWHQEVTARGLINCALRDETRFGNEIRSEMQISQPRNPYLFTLSPLTFIHNLSLIR